MTAVRRPNGAGDRLTRLRRGSSARTLYRIANGDADCVVPPSQAERLHEALTRAGDAATLTILPGTGHEDPAFMRTQLAPTVAFLDQTIGK